jgi:hypothetical protein
MEQINFKMLTLAICSKFVGLLSSRKTRFFQDDKTGKTGCNIIQHHEFFGNYCNDGWEMHKFVRAATACFLFFSHPGLTPHEY